jgi:hypothetical protein
MNEQVYLLQKLNSMKVLFGRQQFKTIRGQILAGDFAGAIKGINKRLDKLIKVAKKCE